MGKTHFLVNVDEDILTETKQILGRGNVSKEINEFLKNLVNTHKNDINAVNIKIMEKKKSKLIEQRNNINRELDQINRQLLLYKEIQEKKEQEELEQQKEQKIKNNTCMNCNEVFIETDIVRLKDNVVLCKECWRIPNIVTEIEQKMLKKELVEYD